MTVHGGKSQVLEISNSYLENHGTVSVIKELDGSVLSWRSEPGV